ncbi:MAG: hypothetical protein GEV13_23710 [Rhodospirillales bacterium]|nr:hypothetical protein [Rhodospirillales bacterium]
MWKATPIARACALVAAVVAIVAGYFVSATSEADVPQYQRRAASQAACEAAADEISRLRLMPPITFVDDCLRPKVTPVYNKPGHLIVTRVVEVRTGRTTARRTYSALMDGGRIDAWRMIRVELAPNELSVVYAPAALAAIEELAEGSRPGSNQSH